MSAESHKENRRYYLRTGRCPRCGGKNPLMPGRSLCWDCAKKHDDQQNVRRAEWKSTGLCARCGGERDSKYKTCAKCRAYMTVLRRKKAAEEKERRDVLRDKGLCTRCGKTWAEPGRAWCRKCADQHKRYTKSDAYREKHRAWLEERVNAGKCIDCGAAVRDGRLRCDRCNEMRKDSNRKYRITQRIKQEAKRNRRRIS